MGGALLPAPDSAADLWRTYTATWHPVGLGSDTAAPPYLAVLAMLATVLLGSAERATDLVLLGAVPLAGLTAYVGLRRLADSVPLRVWGAVGYALLPPVLGAVAAGRLGTAVVAVLLPLVALTATRALAGPPDDPRRADRATAVTVLLLAVVVACAPTLWLALLVLAVGGILGMAGTGVPGIRAPGRALVRVAVLVVGPVLLLLPWLPAVGADPALLLLEPGLAGRTLVNRDLGPLDLVLLRPGGPGLPPALLTVGLLSAALAALLRPSRRVPVLLGWTVALVGLAAALAVSTIGVSSPTQQIPVPAWPAPAMLLAGAGLVVAAVAGADGARSRIARASFGWRQPAALAVLVLAAAGPVATAAWWLGSGAGDPLDRREPVLLPAFVAAEGDEPARPRTLVLRAVARDELSFALERSGGPRIGAAELSPPRPDRTGLDGLVADLASGRGGDAAARLVPFGVRFVLLVRPAQRPLVRAIDAVPGVVRVSGPSGAVLWRLAYPTGRVRVVPGQRVVEADSSAPPTRVLAAGQTESHATVGRGKPGRLLVLADRHDGGWRATVDGTALRPGRYDGWAQAFSLPADGGQLALVHDPGLRPALLWIQLGLVLVVVVLALPPLRWLDALADIEGSERDGGAGA